MDELIALNQSCDNGWAEREFSGVEFGDKRINRRMIKVMEELSSNPLAPINQASGDWASTKATYRLLSNPKVNEEELFRAHREQTIKRFEGEELVRDAKAKGVLLHHTLCINEQGLPFGLLSQQKRTRQELKKTSHGAMKKLPIEEKESYRWLEALRATVSFSKGAKKVVTICDREADIYEFFEECRNLGANYVVRVLQNRVVLHEDETKSIRKSVLESKVCGTINVAIVGREGEKAKQVVVSVRFAEVTMKNPKSKNFDSGFQAYAIYLDELNPVSEEERLNWLLLTNIPVTDLEGATEKINWYKRRWSVETYHKVLKSGCKVESSRLEHIDRLNLYITMMGIVAWRLFWMTHIARSEPDKPASAVLTELELQALSFLAGKKKKIVVPIKTTFQAITEIAKLGGFLGRKSDGFPGPIVVWRGWEKLSNATDLLEAMDYQRCG